ncbi:hypothetical protein [Candidatus Nitrosopumilus sp. SW]|nr:hypothetical protein [Candidatus Nitrosopumilus sp. SW]
MTQESMLESTFAAIAKTEEELFQMISKKLSKDKEMEQPMATIVAVS